VPASIRYIVLVVLFVQLDQQMDADSKKRSMKEARVTKGGSSKDNAQKL
jgi:hypothetical protein